VTLDGERHRQELKQAELGMGLGAAAGTALSHLVMEHVGAIPPWSLAVALLVPAAVGLAFGIYPAHKAAKLDPIESLRYE
jgi:putative ABC transport system permease protein